MQPYVTVIVCTRDRPAELAQCLAALAGQTYRPFDVLVVDNAPRIPIGEICERFGSKYLVEPIAGLSRARNAGARAAKGDIVAFIDDDAVAESDWLDALVKGFSDPTIAAVAGTIRYMKARGDTRFVSHEPATSADTRREAATFDLDTPEWFSVASFGGIGDGGNMAFRKTLFAGGVQFDERLGRGKILDGGDEHTVFASLIAREHRIRCAPDAVVRHPWPPSPEPERAKRLRDLQVSIAYVLFLWFELAAYRGDILRFIGRALRKRVKPGRSTDNSGARLSRWRVLTSMLRGVFVYIHARRQFCSRAGANEPMHSLMTLRLRHARSASAL